MNTPFLVCAAITSVSGLISLGFSLAAVRVSTAQAQTLALYACARSAALAVISLYAFVGESVQWLEAAATAMIITQSLDAAIGVAIKDTMKTFGPAATAVANLAAAVWLVSKG